MPEDIVSGAGKSILDVGVIGAVCILLIVALAWVVRTWRLDVAAVRQELQDERKAHLETREAWLEDVKEYAAIGESVRDQMRALITLYNSTMEVIKDSRRDR